MVMKMIEFVHDHGPRWITATVHELSILSLMVSRILRFPSGLQCTCTRSLNFILFFFINKQRMIGWLLLNDNQSNFPLCHGENKSLLDGTKMMSPLYYTNTLFWIFIMLDYSELNYACLSTLAHYPDRPNQSTLLLLMMCALQKSRNTNFIAFVMIRSRLNQQFSALKTSTFTLTGEHLSKKEFYNSL